MVDPATASAGAVIVAPASVTVIGTSASGVRSWLTK